MARYIPGFFCSHTVFQSLAMMKLLEKGSEWTSFHLEVRAFHGIALTSEAAQQAAIHPHIFHSADSDACYSKVPKFQ